MYNCKMLYFNALFLGIIKLLELITFILPYRGLIFWGIESTNKIEANVKIESEIFTKITLSYLIQNISGDLCSE